MYDRPPPFRFFTPFLKGFLYVLPIYLRTRVDNDSPSFGLTRPSFLEVLETMFYKIFKCELMIVTWFARRHNSI